MTSESATTGATGWQDAVTAAALMIVDPAGCGGASIKARAGAVLDAFLATFRDLAASSAPIVKLPPGTTDDRLIGGLDLGRTLEQGRPVLEPGLLARAHGGVLLVPGAERLSAGIAARIAAAHDRATVAVEREGLGQELPARFALLLLDESCEPDDAPPASLMDRVAFHLDLDRVSCRDTSPCLVDGGLLHDARRRLDAIPLDPATIEVMIEAADALGIASQRAPMLALRAARAAAALWGRTAIAEEDLLLATRLVLAPRATRAPADESADTQSSADDRNEPEEDSENRDQTPPSDEANGSQENAADEVAVPLDVLLAAARAALPAGLLDTGQARRRNSNASAGHAGRHVQGRNRGARMASRPGSLEGGARLDVIATLRAAAPYQSLRRAAPAPASASRPAVLVRRQDIRIARFKQRSETLTVFAVDASGSAALHRLAEAKGAVELLLADCYVRRDWVGLIAFRGTGSTLLLPPTRSLTRAKRALGELAGGGGTPLAAGMRSALALARAASRQGRTATTVILTDGRPNVTLEGKPGRPAAEADALAMARVFAGFGERALVIDTDQRPNAFARKLAATLRGSHVALPYADAGAVNKAVRAVT
jgi:magnesium chelatase subunit D